MEANTFCTSFISRWRRVIRYSLLKSNDTNVPVRPLRSSRIGPQKKIAPWLPIMAEAGMYCMEFNLGSEDSGLEGILTLLRPEDIPDRLLGLFASSGHLFHYIRLNDSMSLPRLSISQRIIQKINQGNRELRFEIWKCYEDMAPFTQVIEKLWVEQHIHHGSPCAPISLLINLVDEGLIQILAGFSREGFAGFITVTRSTHYAHVNWVLVNRSLAKSYVSVSLWMKAFDCAHKMGCSILSMGSTSSESLARFKESVGGIRATDYKVLLRDGKISYVGSSYSYQKALLKRFARLILIRFMRINAVLGHGWYSIVSSIIWRYAT